MAQPKQHKPAKLLRPPFRMVGDELVEDSRYQYWTEIQIKAMRNGTYDWSKHEEVRTDGAG